MIMKQKFFSKSKFEGVNMEFSLDKQINLRLKRLDEMSSKIKEKIKTLPEGRIIILKRKSGVYYYNYVNENNYKYIRKNNRKTVEALIQKNYLEEVMKSINCESTVIKKIQKLYPNTVAEDVYDHLSEDRKPFVKPIVLPDDQFIRRWQESQYTPKPFSNDVPFFMTMKGERVRSKSEMIIADRLLAKGIPYKYECPLLVGDNEIIHPDFTILRISDRKIIYYEHCGRMDDPGYVEDIVSRVNDYNRAGIFQGDRLFMTFETSKTPLDVRVVDNLINSIFM